MLHLHDTCMLPCISIGTEGLTQSPATHPLWLQVVLGFLPVPILLVTALYLMMEVAEPVGGSAGAGGDAGRQGCTLRDLSTAGRTQ
jgi:hypothetical protein